MRRSPGSPPGFLARFVPTKFFCGPAFLALQLGRPQGFIHSDSDGVELVIAGHLLDQRAAAVVLEHNEVADQRQEAVRVESALQHHLELGHFRVRQLLAGYGAPGLEPFTPCSQRTNTRRGPVRDHQRLVHGIQGGQLRFVGLKLLPCRPDGGVLIGRVLQFDDTQRQPVDQEDDIRAAFALVLGDGELVNGQPVVISGVVKVHDPHLCPADTPISVTVLHGHAVDEHAVEGAVAGFQVGPPGRVSLR